MTRSIRMPTAFATTDLVTGWSASTRALMQIRAVLSKVNRSCRPRVLGRDHPRRAALCAGHDQLLLLNSICSAHSREDYLRLSGLALRAEPVVNGRLGARSRGGRALARPVSPGAVSLLAVLMSTCLSVVTDATAIATITATAKSTRAVR